MAATVTPAPQHMRALERGNAIRLARAALKHDIADGYKTVAEVLRERPWEAESMEIADLLMAQHRWGRTRMRRLVTSVPVMETKQLGTLTDRQRAAITNRLEGRTPDPFGGWA